ncbi:hypothetical protein CRYUN_Cryun27aG0097900 [Craigia yunnanensis]
MKWRSHHRKSFSNLNLLLPADRKDIFRNLPGVSSPPYFDDEVDANSVAATSAAAVKNAIEEAQAWLKVAKERMVRRKGHIGSVKPSFNGKAEERKKGKNTVKQNNFRQDEAQETCEKIDASVQTSVGVREQNVMKVGQVVTESEDREKSFIAREAAGGTCAKNFISSQADCRQEEVKKREAAKEREREKDVMQALNEYEREEKKIIEKPEKYGEKSKVVEDATEQEYERKLDASKEICDEEECLHKLKPNLEFHDRTEDETKLRFFEQWEETEEKEENGSAFEKEENEMLLQNVSIRKELEKIYEEAFEISGLKGEHKEACGPGENNEEEDACNREENEHISDKMEKPEIIDLRYSGFDYEEERERRLEENNDSLGNKEFMEAEENEDLFKDAYQMEAVEEGQKVAPERVGTEEMQKQTDQKADETTETREDALECCQEDLEAANDAYDDNEINNLENGGIAEGTKAYSECKETRRDSEAVEVANDLEENLAFDKADLAESNLKLSEIEQQKKNRNEAFDFDRHGIDVDTADITFEQNQYEQHSKESEIIDTTEKHVEELACESEEHLHCKFGEKHETTQIAHEIEISNSTEYNEESHHETLMKEERETKHYSQEEVKLVKEQQRRVDEAKEREREREKERIAVERAICEARERAFAEACERAAAGRTNVEARPERAAVERATTEARQRALEKALSKKASFGARKQAEKFSDAKQSFQSYAKALAEKNKHDLLAQKEQAERNRLAETLDAEVKRWSSGKQGNLRALLSTLQYTLGPDSGWQPIPLTDIIATAAVKKAYRKATLCVHPDKLQQRGASIQQKYTCEKVFDLLKVCCYPYHAFIDLIEAGNKFSAGQR